MLILLSLLAADVPIDANATIKLADQHIIPADEPAAPRRSRYRLDPNVAGPADGKDDALAITGADCERIGNLYCTTKPRTIYSSAY